jgi:hypothetical protein
VDSVYQLDKEMCLEALQAVNSVKSSPADCHIMRFKTDVSETDSIPIICVLIQLDIWPIPIIFLHQARAHGSTPANIVEVSSLLGGDIVPQIVQFLTF